MFFALLGDFGLVTSELHLADGVQFLAGQVGGLDVGVIRVGRARVVARAAAMVLLDVGNDVFSPVD